jgi:hypothetical protein
MSKRQTLDVAGEILRLQSELRGGRKLTPREQRLARRRITRMLREGRRRRAVYPSKQQLAPDSKIAAHTQAKYEQSLTRIEAILAGINPDTPGPTENTRGAPGRREACLKNKLRGNRTRTGVIFLHSLGLSVREIAEAANVSPRRVSQILQTLNFRTPKKGNF